MFQLKSIIGSFFVCVKILHVKAASSPKEGHRCWFHGRPRFLDHSPLSRVCSWPKDFIAFLMFTVLFLCFVCLAEESAQTSIKGDKTALLYYVLQIFCTKIFQSWDKVCTKACDCFCPNHTIHVWFHINLSNIYLYRCNSHSLTINKQSAGLQVRLAWRICVHFSKAV